MSYRLKRKEPVPDGIKRLAAEQIDAASSQLASGKNREEAVHEARKCVKKTRGLLSLASYQKEDKRLRDIGRALSAIRDATVIVETFDGLLEKHKATLKKEQLAGVRRELVQAPKSREGIERALTGLRAVRGRIETLPIQTDGFAAVEEGLIASYRRGRKRLRLAEETGDARDFHEFRKSAKEHWYHMRLFEGLWPEPVGARVAALKDLETWLGEHHNLDVLRGKLPKEPQEAIQLFLALVETEQKELERNSISLARRLYEQKPKLFVRDLSKLWDVWHEEAKLPPRKQPAPSVSKRSKTA